MLAKTHDGYKISFILRDYATVICGDNSVGKTFLFHELKNEYHHSGCNKPMIFIDNTNPKDLYNISGEYDGIVVVDKVEVINDILGTEVQYILHDLGKQCIVFCNTESALNYHESAYFSLILDPHNKRIMTEPTYQIKEVFPNNIPGYGSFFTHKFFLEGKE